MPMRRLPQSLINKIAAGEVVERPASVVKELMENAVDAGATRIDVSVQAGGIEMIRVADNGSGIAADELELAVASHATSKLREADDLFHVNTLGFRGEALASIAEISRLALRSRTAASPAGAQIEVLGGQPSGVTPSGCPVGTIVEVANLFYNTPVRRKFLRSTPTELGHVSEAFTRIALPLPAVHFTLSHNDKPLFELPATDNWLDRIQRLFGAELAKALVWVESTDGQVRLAGYVALPTQSRSSNRMQYLFLNRRSIRDRALQHALQEAYRGLLMTGKFAVAVLTLDMPPDLVDVNVHPTKLEVRFQDSGRLYSQILSTLRTKFLTTDLAPRVNTVTEDPTGAHDPEQVARMRQQVVDWAKGKMTAWAPGGSSPGGSSPGTGTADATGLGVATAGDAAPSAADFGGGDTGPRAPLVLNRLDRSWGGVDAAHHGPPGAAAASGQSSGSSGVGPNPATQAAAGPAGWGLPAGPAVQALQIHNRYLVAESAEGVVVIDQHALHERILYEQLRQRIESGRLESQSLLVPEPVDLAPAETAAALENREVLAQLGLKIEPFGGDTLLVSSYPAMLANMPPAEVLRGVVERLLSGGKLPERRDLLDDLLHMIACKAAIKAGDRLTPGEITALLEQRHLVDDAHHCPHGRPTALVFTREELDKQFKRI